MLRDAGRTSDASPADTRAAEILTKAGLHRIGTGVNAPGLEKRVEPAYPYEARQAQRLGTVVLAWRFKPATKDGAPVAVVASVDVNFRLL